MTGLACIVFQFAVILFPLTGSSVFGYSYIFQGLAGEGSHFNTLARLAEVLVYRGHSVTFILSSEFSYQTADPRWGSLFNFELYETKSPNDPNGKKIEMNRFVETSITDGITEGVVRHIPKLFKRSVLDCDDILSNKTFINRLRKKHFDMTVYDPSSLCGLLITEKLNIKSVIFSTCGYHHGLAGIFGVFPNVAYVPMQFENIPSQPFTFYQRLHNIYSMVMFQMMVFITISEPYDVLRVKHNVSLNLRIDQLFVSNTELVLMNMDAAIELSVPLTPNIIPVGGLSGRPANRLPQELEDFVHSAGEDGVVIFALGSYINDVPQRILDVIINALSTLPYKVVWKFDNKDGLQLSSNIKTMKWLPLNDLLGHKQSKVFVHHGGNNGFYEAVYHGVPMVILPVFGDQAQVAQRAEDNGIGVMLEIGTMTSAELKHAIIKVMTNLTIKQSMRKVFDIYHDKPMNASDTAGYWIEHITKFGADPYQSSGSHLNFLQTSLLDVYMFLLAVVVVISFFAYQICNLFCSCVTGS